MMKRSILFNRFAGTGAPAFYRILFAGIVAVVIGAAASADTSIVTLSPVADARVQKNNSNPGWVDTNYGNENWLRTQINNNVEYESFIRFDLSGVLGTTINSAILRLYRSVSDSAGKIRVYSCDNDTWGELSITYNNRPPKGTPEWYVVYELTDNLTTTPHDIDITPWVVSEFSNDSAKLVTVIVSPNPVTDDGWNQGHRFASREHGTIQGPRLILDVEGEAESRTISGTITQDGVGLPRVTITGIPGSVVTDGDGFYTGTVPNGWNGTATPSRTGYTFDPANRNYTNVQTDQMNQDYSAEATPLARWSYMTPNSYWSFPIQQAPVDPNSDYYIENWKSISSVHSIRTNSANSGEYGHQIYWGTASDPLWSFTETITGKVFSMRGPAGMEPSPGDYELAVIDTTQDGGNGILYAFGGMGGFNWILRQVPGAVKINYLKSNGVDGRNVHSDDWRNTGHRGLPIMTFGFLVKDVEAMHVPNLVKLTVPRSGKSPYMPRHNHVWPYAGNEGDITDLPEGARVRLKASVQPRIDSMTNPYARAMAQSLLTFGSIISDQGGFGINMKVQTGGDSLARWGAMGITGAALSEFTIDDFEFVELGWSPPGM